MNDGTKELIKYGITFVVLIGIFFGGTNLLKGILGTKYPMMVVVSQSMVPTLGVGDFIFIQSINNMDEVVAAEQPEGDILVFLRPGRDNEYIVHRAIDKEYDGLWYFTTKGDNNLNPDSTPVEETRVHGKVIANIPILGYFSLFIKTLKGFGLVVALMIIAFFYDYLFPDKNSISDKGRFPKITLLPFIFTVLTPISIYFGLKNPTILEIVTILIWYLGCFLLPLASKDDDSAIMIWLYHQVLLIIPLSCDLVWQITRITPSNWWIESSSIVPITWLIMKETVFFQKAFLIILTVVLPGITLFLLSMYAKRMNWGPFIKFSKKLRGIPEPINLESSLHEKQQE